VISGIQGLHAAEVEDVDGFRARLILAADRATAGLIDVYEANSPGAIDLLVRRGFRREKVRYIPNAIDASTWPTRGERKGAPPTVVNVSRFIPRKRQGDLVCAAAELIDRVTCRFVLAGDGPSLEDVKALAKHLRVDDIVSFPGSLSTEEVQRLLVGADLFVQPSLWEGMPAAVLEAMASEVAVVGTDVNGIRDLVARGRTGWLVEPCRPDLLAAAIAEALSDPKRLNAYGRAGRARVLAEFDLQPVVECKASLYSEMARVQ
jgi:glycosyltransferase involved in cell wall biosynthesis